MCHSYFELALLKGLRLVFGLIDSGVLRLEGTVCLGFNGSRASGNTKTLNPKP